MSYLLAFLAGAGCYAAALLAAPRLAARWRSRARSAPPQHPLLGRDATARWMVRQATDDQLMGGRRELPGESARVVPLAPPARRNG